MAEKIFYQNYKEDFLFLFQFSDGVRPDYPWMLVFNTYVGQRKSVDSFVASFDGSAYHNCEPGENTADAVLVKFKDHRLPPGRLHFSLRRKVPNEFFEDGEQKRVLPVSTDWELWKGATDGETPPVTTIIAERVLKGDAGQIESMTASVDGTTGTPHVVVELGGTPDKRAIALKFSGLKGETPAITADEEGNIYSDGKLVTVVVAEAVDKAETATYIAITEAGRAKLLADHPPKIVTVGDTNYWAFWDEKKGDYVTSAVRSDGGPIFATFTIDPATMLLSVTYQPGYGNGSDFELSNGHLYYEINN